jgi:anaerobic dimethyl sulfoxide reductase subunit B (iron-sulfur subunit)
MENRQLGFDFDAEKCVQCHACEVACKAAHQVELGIKWRRVVWFWSGQFPAVANRTVSLSCQHCGNPPCETVCPTGAIRKLPGYGIVVVDPARCIGCHSCLTACPFGVPQYGTTGKMQKCDLCVDRIEAGREPACVATCPSGALRFGPLNELSEKAMTLFVRKLVQNADETFSTANQANARKA